MHMVIRLKDGPRSPEQYDQYVSARLPPGPPLGNTQTGACLEPGCCCRNTQPPEHCGCGTPAPTTHHPRCALALGASHGFDTCSLTCAGAGRIEDKECTCDSVLWHAVLQHMTHVCGDDAPCRDSSTGRCKYLYDEERFSPVTVHANKKRPQYKRIPPIAGGRFAYKMVRIGGSSVPVMITDSHVVPHNPWLLLAPVGFKYQFDTEEVCAIVSRHGHRDAWHSNMEISSNPTSNIKYLYLYFCKGEDRVLCELLHHHLHPICPPCTLIS